LHRWWRRSREWDESRGKAVDRFDGSPIDAIARDNELRQQQQQEPEEQQEELP